MSRCTDPRPRHCARQEVRRPVRRRSPATTALCTVGRTGNDLHYRGYDILDIAERCDFEEIAHLLVHGSLPTEVQLAAYKTKLRSLRGLPAAVKRTLEAHSGGGASDGRDAHAASRRWAACCPKRPTTIMPARATSPTG